MSIEFYDGWDYQTTGYSLRWDANTYVQAYTTGRYGSGQAAGLLNNAFYLLASGASGSARGLLSQSASKTVGFAFNSPGWTAGFVLASWYDGATTQCDLRMDGSGHLYVTRNATVLGTSTSIFSTGTWYYCEFSATIGASGSYSVSVSGTSWLTGTGNTQNTANASTNGMVMNPSANGLVIYVDDLYIRNDTTMLGEVRCIADAPNADGTTLQWTPNTGTTHYTQVTSNDGDTSYVSDATAGHIDLYKFPSYTASGGSTKAVQVIWTGRKVDSAAHAIDGYISSGSGTATGPDTALTTGYMSYAYLSETDPNGAIPWTDASVSAVQLGMRTAS